MTAVVCALTGLLGLWFISIQDDRLMVIWSWVGVLMLGLGTVAALYQLKRPSKVILTANGFAMTGLIGTGLIPWADVETFFVYEEAPPEDTASGERTGGGMRHAVWKLKPDVAASERLVSRLTRASDLPFDGSLPRNLGMNAPSLVALMEDWRLRHSG